MTVSDLTSRIPKQTLTGGAKCMACGHEWTATTAWGTCTFGCPECGCGKGVWAGFVNDRTEYVWHCSNCQGWVYEMHALDAMCLTCGATTTYAEIAGEPQ